MGMGMRFCPCHISSWCTSLKPAESAPPYAQPGRALVAEAKAHRVGDVLTVVAGVLKTPVWLFFLLVAVAKTGRYLVLGLIVLGVIG